MDPGISEKSVWTGVIGDGFEEEVGLIKEQQQRGPQDFNHVSVPGVGKCEPKWSGVKGHNSAEVCLVQDWRV